MSAWFCACPAFTFTTFLVGFAVHASSSLFVFALPCCQRFFPIVGFAGYIWFSVLFALLFNVRPLFAWALRAVFISYVICPAVIDLPSLWALRAIFLFGLCFALLLTSALFSCGLCGQSLFEMLFALLLTICPLCGLCGLYFDLACFSPCF